MFKWVTYIETAVQPLKPFTAVDTSTIIQF